MTATFHNEANFLEPDNSPAQFEYGPVDLSDIAREASETASGSEQVRQDFVDYAAAVRRNKADAYDTQLNSSAAVTAWVGRVGAMAGMAAGEAAIITSDHSQLFKVYSAAFAAGAVVAGVGYALGGDSNLPKLSEKRPPGIVFDGWTLELLRANRAGQKDLEGKLVLAAFSADGARRTIAAGQMAALRKLAEQCAADALLVPCDTASPRNRDGTSLTSPASLPELLAQIKDYALDTPTGLRSLEYSLLHLADKDQAPSGLKQDLLGKLAAKFPGAALPATMPATAEAARSLARSLHCIAHDSAARQLELQVYRLRGEPTKHKLHSYATAAEADAFEPAIWVHRIDSQNGTARERKLVSDFRGSKSLQDLASADELAAADILPATIEILEELRDIAKRPETADYAPQYRRSDQPVLRTRRMARESWRWRRHIAKSVGALMLGGAVANGMLGGLQLLAPQRPATNLSLDTGVMETGVGTSGGPPLWRLEDNGLDPAGYYAAGTYSHLDSELVWRNSALVSDQPVTLPQLPKDQPHIDVTGYFSQDSLPVVSVEGRGRFMYTALPERNGTDVAAVDVEVAGKDVSHEVHKLSNGLTAVMILDAPDGILHVNYTLAPIDGQMIPEAHAVEELSVYGINHDDPAVGINTIEPTIEAADRMAAGEAGFIYDNSQRIDAMVDAATSTDHAPRELYDLAQELRIANCNVAVGVTAVQHALSGNSSPLAAVSGYLSSGRYMNQPHAWLVDGSGNIIDATPPLAGRTAQEAGLTVASDESLDATWEDYVDSYQNETADVDPQAPWRQAWGLALAAGALASVSRRLRYTARNLSDRFDSRRLTMAQAERVIAHRAFGRAGDTPDLSTVAERMSKDSLPVNTIAKVAADPRRAAPYLSRRQQRSLGQHARRLLG